MSFLCPEEEKEVEGQCARELGSCMWFHVAGVSGTRGAQLVKLAGNRSDHTGLVNLS